MNKYKKIFKESQSIFYNLEFSGRSSDSKEDCFTTEILERLRDEFCIRRTAELMLYDYKSNKNNIEQDSYSLYYESIIKANEKEILKIEKDFLTTLLGIKELLKENENFKFLSDGNVALKLKFLPKNKKIKYNYYKDFKSKIIKSKYFIEIKSARFFKETHKCFILDRSIFDKYILQTNEN